MAGRVVFIIQNGGYEPAYAASSMGITSVAMGEEVCFVFAFDALRQLSRGTFGQPNTEREISESARAKGLGVPPPQKMLEEARSLGAKLVACDTTVKICGLGAEDLKGSSMKSWGSLPCGA
jgi:peroxiredoxin family protein